MDGQGSCGSSRIRFQFGDQFMAFAEHGKLVFGAHLVWDEGFGEGWEALQPKPAYFALEEALASAPERTPVWQLPPYARGSSASHTEVSS